MRVAIHRNLTTNRWVVSSVKVTRNGERKDKRLHDTDSVSLTDVSFVTCSEKSIKRIQSNILDKSKSAGREVVAYAIGTLSDFDVSDKTNSHVSWNPLKGRDFYLVDFTDYIVTKNTFDYASFSDLMWVNV